MKHPAPVIDNAYSQDSRGSKLERAFETQLIQGGFPPWKREYVFHPRRMWRFDFCWEVAAFRCAVEVEGGTWTGGRHVTGRGFADDCKKLNEAAILGYHVLRLTADMVDDGTGLEMLERLFRAKCPNRRWTEIVGCPAV